MLISLGFMKRGTVRLTSFIFSLIAITCITGHSARAITIDLFDGAQSAQANPGSEATSQVADASVLGGTRGLRVDAETGLAGLFARATVVSGVLTHSQDATITGLSEIVWDGDLNPGLTANGLGGVSLVEDGGDSFLIDVVSFDYANSKPLKLNIFVYDASDPSGNTYSSTQFQLNRAVSSPETFTIPFINIDVHGLNGPASFENVGALVIQVDGLDSPDRDFTMSAIRTNGSCPLAPALGGKVLDECGVCGGDNSTCRDCAGVINGSAVEDRCGVCAGDGQSCLGCESRDLTPLLATLDGGAKKQENLIRLLLRQYEKRVPGRKTKLFVKRTRKMARELQIRNWVLSWTVPSLSVQCENKLFCSSASNVSIMDEYRVHNEELRQIAIAVAEGIKVASGKETRRVVQLLQKNEELFATNEQNSYRVPLTHDRCE